eukprot:6177692-Pleurochrysis_carterae.AAC.1
MTKCMRAHYVLAHFLLKVCLKKRLLIGDGLEDIEAGLQQEGASRRYLDFSILENIVYSAQDQSAICVALPASQRIGRDISRSMSVHARANAIIS